MVKIAGIGVVYSRLEDQCFAIDSASYFSNLRTNFANIYPKWFIEVIR
jgi:hypothetical protein